MAKPAGMYPRSRIETNTDPSPLAKQRVGMYAETLLCKKCHLWAGEKKKWLLVNSYERILKDLLEQLFLIRVMVQHFLFGGWVDINFSIPFCYISFLFFGGGGGLLCILFSNVTHV
jgi:hypothetical protein